MDASTVPGWGGALTLLGVGFLVGFFVSRAFSAANRIHSASAIRGLGRGRDREYGTHTAAPAQSPGQQPESEQQPSRLPQETANVLAVLWSASVVLDSSGTVVRASPSAHALGVVKDNRLIVAELARMAHAAQRGGRIGELEMELPRGPFGHGTITLVARVAPLGSRLILILLEDRTEARRVDEIRRDFVANVSHELKTPVGALALLAEAVLGASDDPGAVRRFAGRMQNEATRLSQLIQELIDLSRVQGHDPLEAGTVVDMDEVVHDAVDRCRLAADARQITLVSGGASGLTVLGNEGQLVTALRNLIDNAIAYSPEQTRVAVAVRRRDGVAEISVTDQGIGIPERDLERIFERFYRVDPARSRATGGTGLGLSIVKHIAANHGGEVSVWSVEGSGSTFTLRLPLGARSTDPSPALPDPSDPSPVPPVREATQ